MGIALEFPFRQDEADAIVRTAAYHCKDFCRSVIWFSPRAHADVRESLATPFPRAAGAGLGPLGRLPLELLHDVLLRLDIFSLSRFRQANLSARRAVHSLNQYHLVVAHGLNLLRALLRTRLTTGISLHDVFRALCTKACTLCGEFGGFISLLTWIRCCFVCLRRAPETQVQTLAGAVSRSRLTEAERGLLKSKSFKTLPGIYTLRQSPSGYRVTVVSLHHVRLVSARQRQDNAPATLARKPRLNFMGSCALPYLRPGNRQRRERSIVRGVSSRAREIHHRLQGQATGIRRTREGLYARVLFETL